MHFTLKNGVAIYGGFAGTENPATFNLKNRDFENNETILSGHFWELHWPPALHFHTYQVFFHHQGTDLDETAMLDGFTISGGKADGIGRRSRGGGIFNQGISPTLVNVNISGNSAEYGGGIYNESSSPNLSNVLISGNSAKYDGGGMCNYYSSLTLTNVIISENSAEYGGGIYNESSSLVLTKVTISENSSISLAGGGIYNRNSNSQILTNVTIANNSGSGLLNMYSNPILTNVTIAGNSSIPSSGGGMSNYSSNPVIENSIFWDNGEGNKEIYNNPESLPTVNWSIVEDGYQGGTNIFTDDPLLQPLADNGGFTKTHAIPRNSPAYAIPKEAGDGNWNGAPDTDQRGFRRAMTGFRAMGAYEDSSLVQPGVLMLLLDDE